MLKQATLLSTRSFKLFYLCHKTENDFRIFQTYQSSDISQFSLENSMINLQAKIFAGTVCAWHTHRVSDCGTFWMFVYDGISCLTIDGNFSELTTTNATGKKIKLRRKLLQDHALRPESVSLSAIYTLELSFINFSFAAKPDVFFWL